MSTDFLTPVGRLVQGDCFVPQTTDAEGKPLVIRNGPNAGQPRVDYFFAIAIPKTAPEWPAIWESIKKEALEGFPHLSAQIQPLQAPNGNPQLTFAFKVTDGDSNIPNTRGIAPNSREGFPGHWVLAYSGGFAPNCYSAGGQAVITDPNMLKRGYFVRVYGSVTGNGSPNQPGVYLNHSMIEMVGYGEEIVTGPNGEAVFGGTPAAALPAGASETPLAPATTIAAPAPQAAAPAPQAAAPAPQAAAPAPQAAAPAPQAAAPAPAPDFLNGEVKFVTPDGGQWTEAQLLAAGYTAAQVQALPKA